ncbi:hypothetical protein ACH5RR_035060 [Cinchona calisaya]|uniref:mitogen-activated protein kinase kinase kinase n=1 Tax=Cinchona calisaya TaxID=153742 RepID=A0ABD2YFZ8_9GENT
MPYNLWAAFKSSSASTSPSDSPQPKLTRQRKLRHAGEDKLGLSRPVKSLPASPDKGPSSSSVSRSSISPHHWSRSAVPHPLPLPEFSSVQTPRSRGESDSSSSPVITSSTFQRTRGKSSDDTASRSSKLPTYQRRGFYKELDVEGIGNDFRLNVPVRSAPGSGFSSPVLSPQRFSTVDLFHSPLQASSASGTSPRDWVVGSPSQLLPTRIMCSPDHSPLQSPTSQNSCMSARKQTGSSLHSYHKAHSDTWLEGNNANVHPLPLPPGVSRPSQSPITHQHMDNSEVSPVKSQWIKGKLLGRGTYGSVYVATNCKTGALCAMKEVDLIPDDSKAQECIKQLEQEIKVLRRLKHPNIVQYYGTETIEDHFCIYLEYIHPGSINKYVQERCRAMTESVVRNFTRHIVSGLAYLHSKKTIHRDIKGANLLVDANGVVKLADFGLAKHLTGQATDLSLKGSPHWMAPEVLQAAMRKDTNSELAFAVDIWSLGCTVIEMLTGKPPWSDFSGVQAMFNVLNKSPPIPDTLSPEGKDFLEQCFRRRPADRPTAARLLKHPFLRNSCDQSVRSCLQELSGMAISSPNDNRNHNKHLKSVLPSIHVKNGELPDNRTHHSSSECLQSCLKVSESGCTPRLSPRSTLDTSSPELNFNSRNISPSNVSRSSPKGPSENIYAFGYSVNVTHGTAEFFGGLKEGKS